jgi:outer membrane protein OmpA-like peptidoglycan-associated protein
MTPMRGVWVVAVLLVACVAQAPAVVNPTPTATPTATTALPVSVPAIAPDHAAPDTRAPKAPETTSFVFSPSVYGRFRFAPGSAALGVDAGKALDLIASSLLHFPRHVRIEGNTATEAHEPASLALQRARKVAAELVRRGVPSTLLVPAHRDKTSDASVLLFEDDDHELAIEYHAWEACCQRDAGGGNVSWEIDETRPDSIEGRARMAEERAQCAQCNGEYGPQGYLGLPGCKCRTKDGRKPCLSPRDCVNRCEIGWDIAIAHRGDVCPPGSPCPIPQGSCSEFFGNSGCHGWIEQDDKGTRTTKWMCVD